MPKIRSKKYGALHDFAIILFYPNILERIEFTIQFTLNNKLINIDFTSKNYSSELPQRKTNLLIREGSWRINKSTINITIIF